MLTVEKMQVCREFFEQAYVSFEDTMTRLEQENPSCSGTYWTSCHGFFTLLTYNAIGNSWYTYPGGLQVYPTHWLRVSEEEMSGEHV